MNNSNKINGNVKNYSNIMNLSLCRCFNSIVKFYMNDHREFPRKHTLFSRNVQLDIFVKMEHAK